jgi:hypothetical protein
MPVMKIMIYMMPVMNIMECILFHWFLEIFKCEK